MINKQALIKSLEGQLDTLHTFKNLDSFQYRILYFESKAIINIFVELGLDVSILESYLFNIKGTTTIKGQLIKVVASFDTFHEFPVLNVKMLRGSLSTMEEFKGSNYFSLYEHIKDFIERQTIIVNK